MRFLVLLSLLISPLAIAQNLLPSAGTEAVGASYCRDCVEHLGRPTTLTRDQLDVIRKTSTLDLLNIQRETAIRAASLESKIQEEAEAEEVRAKENSYAARANRMNVTISSMEAFDQQTADELAQAMKTRGLRSSTVVDFHLVNAIDEAQQSEARARFRKALKRVFTPLLKEVRGDFKDNLDELKAQIFAKKTESSKPAEANASREDRPKKEISEDKLAYNWASILVDTFEVDNRKVRLKILGLSDPDNTRYVGVVKKHGDPVQLEARYGQTLERGMKYGVSANLQRDEGRNQGSVYFYLGAALDANFVLVKKRP